MRIFIGIFVILTLVMATSFPSLSHAMMTSHDSAQTEQAKASDEGDCHKHAKAEQSGKTAQSDKESDKCCDKGVCKCVSGTCHNLSKYFGDGNNSLSILSSESSVFAFDNQFVDSALSNRLKRPPRA